MRITIFAVAFGLGMAGVACGGAPVAEGDTQGDDVVNTESQAITKDTASAAADCRNWAGCHRVCFHTYPRGNPVCDDRCDEKWPQCDVY